MASGCGAGGSVPADSEPDAARPRQPQTHSGGVRRHHRNRKSGLVSADHRDRLCLDAAYICLQLAVDEPGQLHNCETSKD